MWTLVSLKEGFGFLLALHVLCRVVLAAFSRAGKRKCVGQGCGIPCKAAMS
jgi:hypothetical protein